MDTSRPFLQCFDHRLASTCHKVTTGSNRPRMACIDIPRLGWSINVFDWSGNELEWNVNEQRQLQACRQYKKRLLYLVDTPPHSLTNLLQTTLPTDHTHTHNILLTQHTNKHSMPHTKCPHQNTPFERPNAHQNTTQPHIQWKFFTHKLPPPQHTNPNYHTHTHTPKHNLPPPHTNSHKHRTRTLQIKINVHLFLHTSNKDITAPSTTSYQIHLNTTPTKSASPITYSEFDLLFCT